MATKTADRERRSLSNRRVALASFVPMVGVYFRNKHSGPMIWSIAVTPPVEAIVTIGMGLALIILVAGIIVPSPASISVGAKKPVELKGIHFITRHAVFMAAGLFGLVHLIPNGFASDIAFFAGFPIFALIVVLYRRFGTDPDDAMRRPRRAC